ncbi:MAG: hypothetical protein DMG33_07000, partial [Acidobacteria bacterium]
MNLKRYALRALEVAKEDLRRDKFLIPVAFIVVGDQVSDFSVQFKDPNQKALVYSELVRIAKEKRADAIITINDAKLTNMVSARSGGAKQDLRTNEGTQDCIYLTVSGPAIRTWSVCLPYERAGYEI